MGGTLHFIHHLLRETIGEFHLPDFLILTMQGIEQFGMCLGDFIGIHSAVVLWSQTISYGCDAGDW